MRTVSVRELQRSIKQCVQYSQKDRIVITQHGEPSAVIIGVKGMDWESVVMETNPRFWKMIRKRRAQPTISLQEAKSRVAGKRPRS
ncbi:MAG: type II toxin-antitoxin system Phd/YefM family antitoxin [Elusimicrobia bacterium]|nr:type II toxin-antitoxin system Phd/YefM family antitoxin [Elusimicrobiota bacterium]